MPLYTKLDYILVEISSYNHINDKISGFVHAYSRLTLEEKEEGEKDVEGGGGGGTEKGREGDEEEEEMKLKLSNTIFSKG